MISISRTRAVAVLLPLVLAALLVLCVPVHAGAQPRSRTRARPPLGARDIDDVAQLEMLEDRRELDTAVFGRLLAAPHPEVRRRAAIAVGRIADRRGLALLRARPLDADTAVAAAVVFAVGQLRDTTTVAWLDSVLASPGASSGVASEAAAALGKLKTGDARAALARFLTTATADARTHDAIGDALLGIGRATPRGVLAPIVPWTRSPDEALRWRATWALFRPRDPAAVATLLTLGTDRSALVRSWAVRGLTRPQADSVGLGAAAEARLLATVGDPDRRVRAEAIRALGTYGDSAAVRAVVAALASRDGWLAVNAAESLGRMRVDAVVAPLVAATAPGRPCAVRATALQALQTAAPDAVIAAAARVASDSVPYCRATALQTLARTAATAPLDAAARAAIDARLADAVPGVRLQAWQAHWVALDATLTLDARRDARRAERPADAAVRAGALRAMVAWADSTDVPWLLDQYARATFGQAPAGGASDASAAVAALAAVQRRQGVGAAAFVARFAPPDDPSLRREIDRAFDASARRAWPAAPTRSLAEYREVVTRWIVPAYDGAPRPRVRWETSRGPIEIELYAGDAPLAVDDFVRGTGTRAVVGTEFIRVVPDFVDQQATIVGGVLLRDEVNRHRLTRGNLAWASAGLDTGIPGYTLGHTPQPHNEGDFTSLGRVVRGMDVVDRIELGDRVTAARMLTRIAP